MDVDAFTAEHSGQWQRLEQLAGRRRLDGAEADELVLLYRQVAGQLATVQARLPDPALSARLSRLLSRGRAAAVGTPRRRGWSALGQAVLVDFPVTLYRTWRWSVGTAALCLGVSAAMMLWLRDHPGRVGRVIPSAQLRQLVDHDFRDYYSAHPARAFAAQVWLNNALVAALALFLGVTVVGTVYLLVQNTVNVGLVGGVLLGAGHGAELFGLLLPHGMLELSAVFVAGGIGLRTGWAWISPGPLPRAQALAAAGQVAGTTALGLVGVLFVSGLLEAFVTPSGLPTWMRIGIGALAETAFLGYVVVLGRRADAIAPTVDVDQAVLPVG